MFNDGNFNGTTCTVSDLIEKHIPTELILEAFAMDLIRDANDPQKSKTFGKTIDRSIPCILTITGFQYLNQIRIKKAIEDLNDSIHRFKVSNDKSSKNIEVSINEFSESSDKYSKELIELTQAIYIFTIIVAALPIYEKILHGNFYEAILLFGGVGVIVAIMLMYFKSHKKRA